MVGNGVGGVPPSDYSDTILLVVNIERKAKETKNRMTGERGMVIRYEQWASSITFCSSKSSLVNASEEIVGAKDLKVSVLVKNETELKRK
jgi:hypothetical protein